MKKTAFIVMILITIASLVYGYMQQINSGRLAEELEQAVARAEASEMLAMRQRDIAEEQRAMAEKAMLLARESQQRAEQAAANCAKLRRK